MIGRLEHVAFLGAVATASTLFDVLFWGVGFLRTGTTSLVAQDHGAGDRRACVETLYRGLILALNGFFLGVGNAMAPLSVTVVAGIVNVAGNYALIFGVWGAPQLGVVGAA